MTKSVLTLARKPSLTRPDEYLAIRQHLEPRLGIGRVAEEGDHAARPASLSVNARSAQNTPRVGLQALETRLHHHENGLGQLRVSLGDVADQLLQIEGVAVRTLDDEGD